ncbi:MAG: glycosyltransferase [Planctomycetota bacterium]
MKKRVLIFIVSYNAENFIEKVLDRIPGEVWNNDVYSTEVLIIDDASTDQTFHRASDFRERTQRANLTILYNPKNQGYGGNQKIGYHYAIEKKFDAVALLHGDGQYAPECIGQMLQPILDDTADVVLGSRMLKKWDALKGRMPFYKWIGNQVLTRLQNRILGSHLAEFHTGYRAFSVPALASIPFMFNSDYFDFDTDILIQLLATQKRIKEISIPTFYGNEICRVNGLKYAFMILCSSLLSRINRYGIFYHPKFDYEHVDNHNVSKLGFPSSHQFALDRVPVGATVLDLACGPAFMAAALTDKQVKTISVDQHIQPEAQQYSFKTIQADLEQYDFSAETSPVNVILALDILEHLKSPEMLLRRLRHRYSRETTELIVTTANVGFLPMRLNLFLGRLNYSRHGILDLDHTRLFTFSSLRRALTINGYDVLEAKGIPVPFALLLKTRWLARLLVWINQMLIAFSKRLFAYQIMMIARPRPTLQQLLLDAHIARDKKLSSRSQTVAPDVAETDDTGGTAKTGGTSPSARVDGPA